MLPVELSATEETGVRMNFQTDVALRTISFPLQTVIISVNYVQQYLQMALVWNVKQKITILFDVSQTIINYRGRMSLASLVSFFDCGDRRGYKSVLSLFVCASTFWRKSTLTHFDTVVRLLGSNVCVNCCCWWVRKNLEQLPFGQSRYTWFMDAWFCYFSVYMPLCVRSPISLSGIVLRWEVQKFVLENMASAVAYCLYSSLLAAHGLKSERSRLCFLTQLGRSHA